MLVSKKEEKIIEAFRMEPTLILVAIDFILSEEDPPRSLPDDLTPRQVKTE